MVQAALRKVLAAGKKYGVPCGIPAGSPEMVLSFMRFCAAELLLHLARADQAIHRNGLPFLPGTVGCQFHATGACERLPILTESFAQAMRDWTQALDRGGVATSDKPAAGPKSLY